jgi:hypothetical protein
MVMVRGEVSFISRFKYDFLLLAALGLVLLGYWLNNNPFTFDAEDETLPGEAPPSIGGAKCFC